ncbi:MAG: tetratricopeptide repeat protein [Flavobacteriales bacterium]|nr:tetratricopeptide repeat protein [Flavobacteriales bacterium]
MTLRSDRLLSALLLLLQVGAACGQIDSLKALIAKEKEGLPRARLELRLARQLLTRDTRDAREHIRSALATAERSLDSETIVLGTFYRGLAARLEGDYPAAIRDLELALAYYRRSGDEERTTGPLFNLAVVRSLQGDLRGAMDLYVEEMTINERSGNEYGLANDLNSIGILDRKLGRPEQAIQRFDSALAIFTRLNETWDQANVLGNRGHALAEMGRHHEAMVDHRRALALDMSLGDDWGVGYQYHYLASAHLALGRADSALLLFRRSLALRNGMDHQLEIAESQLGVARSLLAGDRAREALPLLDSARMVSSSIRAMDLLAEVLHWQGFALERTGDAEAAYLAERRSAALKDSLLNAETLRQVNELEARFESARKDRDLAESNLRLANQQVRLDKQRWFILLAALAALALAVVVALLWRDRLRSAAFAREREARAAKEREAAAYEAMLLGEEAERRRVAAELHDGIGVLLSSALMYGSTDGTGHDRSSRLVAEACSEVRRISHALMPATLERAGLVKALEELALDVGRRASLHVEAHAHGFIERIPAKVEVALYRIVQEALNNALKHAQAREVTIDMERTGRRVDLVISDDGHGFDQGGGPMGNGLANIRSRAELLGGTALLHSSAKGTSWEVSVPLND